MKKPKYQSPNLNALKDNKTLIPTQHHLCKDKSSYK